MAEKIQTEFAEFVVRKMERDPDRYRYHPPKCKFKSKCVPMCYSVNEDDSYFCCGIAITDDEDVIVLCSKNSIGHDPIWSRFTIPEAIYKIELLSHTVHECMTLGMPDYTQVMGNYVQTIRDDGKGTANNFGRILRNRYQ